ncbi:hypothetical protein [Lacticaseibacillus chiayiensis]|uniref:Uncharacterized protein n=1 Tax=Lacticaseibacillus chiayiensis TaxID=2100821 RepID=A0ABY6H5U6_9LACO|nr:hypothetical protein [Lacticaseibacillus chiayiensis]QVI34490.1 hypothetical protein KG086_12035 [Lacticaseibacillus chiayiensis]UYN56225.1 hypothetical protein OFW50_12265 [Lacticaseibacillus chiayiensis]
MLTAKAQHDAAHIRAYFDQHDAFLRKALGENADVVIASLKQLQQVMAGKLAEVDG